LAEHQIVANSKGHDDEASLQDCSYVWLDRYSIVRKFGRSAGAPRASGKDVGESGSTSAAKAAGGQAAPLEVPELNSKSTSWTNGLEVILSRSSPWPMVAVNLCTTWGRRTNSGPHRFALYSNT